MRTVKQHWKTLTLAAIVAAGLGSATDANAAASKKNVMCVQTNTGNFFPVIRVSMMVVPDGGSTFEIVLKDGQGEAGVQSVSFGKHEVEIDFDKYKTNSDGTNYIDLSKPVYLLTNTGKFWKMVNLPVMTVEDGSNKIDVEVGGLVEKGVTAVYFYRGDEDGISGIEPMVAVTPEKLQLQTPIREQMTISGCGDAPRAQVYSLDGKLMTEAAVSNGVTTIQVGQLNAGVYVVRVGNKSLKFTKK
jgi:hypothetical protein